MSRAFVRFSGKGDSEHGKALARWFCQLHLRPDVEESLTRGVAVATWDVNTRFTPKVRGPIEDVPWCMGSVPVVSDRVRRLIETHAPGNAQFLAVRVLYAGQPFDAGQPYWAVNWLHITDFDVGTDPAVARQWALAYSVPDQRQVIPPDVHIFRWRQNPFVEFMSTDLKNKVLEARITGIQFW